MIWLRPELWLVTLGLLLLAAVAVATGLWIVRAVGLTVHATLVSDGRLVGSRVRVLLRALALVAWAMVLPGPSWGERSETPSLYQREVLLAVDMSASMRAEDLPPNRLVRMREMVHRLVEAAPGYRYGLIVFAGDAWERVPFTYDRSYIDQVLGETDPSDIRPQGTDLVKPMERAADIARRNQARDTTVVLFTDGEHTGESSADTAAILAKQAGIRVLAVSLGLPEGSAIPLPSGGYVKDAQGDIVYSRPDRAFLDKLAQETGGLHLVVDSANTPLDALTSALQSVEAKRKSEMRMQMGIDRSVWWIGAGWLLLLASLVPLRWLALRRRAAPAAAAMMLMVVGCGPRDAGSRHFGEGDYTASARWFAGEAARTGDPRLLHNLGASLYRLEQYPLSMTASAAAATRETEAGPRGDALYNAGNAAYRIGDYVRAVQLYRAALDARDDEDTRVNLELAMRKLADLQQQAQQPRPQPTSGADQSNADGTAPTHAQPETSPAQSAVTEGSAAADGPRDKSQQPTQGADPTDEQAPDKAPERSSVLLRKRLEELRETNALAYPDSDRASGNKPW